MLTDSQPGGTTNVTNLKRYDYLPFGGELGLVDGRTAAMGYPTVMDSLNPRFAGKNRDCRSNLIRR